jgi:hypothetical protein
LRTRENETTTHRTHTTHRTFNSQVLNKFGMHCKTQSNTITVEVGGEEGSADVAQTVSWIAFALTEDKAEPLRSEPDNGGEVGCQGGNLHHPCQCISKLINQVTATVHHESSQSRSRSRSRSRNLYLSQNQEGLLVYEKSARVLVCHTVQVTVYACVYVCHASHSSL